MLIKKNAEKAKEFVESKNIKEGSRKTRPKQNWKESAFCFVFFREEVEFGKNGRNGSPSVEVSELKNNKTDRQARERKSKNRSRTQQASTAAQEELANTSRVSFPI